MFSQLLFENVSPPDELNISKVYVSPSEEIFITIVGDNQHIYTSTDNGSSWKQEKLPFHLLQPPVKEIYFYSDGTPIINRRNNEGRQEAYIRTLDTWEQLGPPNFLYSFDHTALIIKDTLFHAYNNYITYSIDKGETFIDYINTVEYSTNLQFHKFDSAVVVYGNVGTKYKIKHYENASLINEIEFQKNHQTVIAKGKEVLIFEDADVHIYNIDSKNLTTYPLNEILSNYSESDSFFVSPTYYYRRSQSSIYRSNKFEEEWEEYKNLADNSGTEFTVDDLENLYSYELKSKNIISTNESLPFWETKHINYDRPYFHKFSETESKMLICLTSQKNIYTKTEGTEWQKLESSAGLATNFEIGPEGIIYICLEDRVLYSTDNLSTLIDLNIPLLNFSSSFTDSFHDFGNGVLMLSEGKDLLSKHYISTNSGESWTEVYLGVSLDKFDLKLVGTFIILINDSDNISYHTINTINGEVNTEDPEYYRQSNFDFKSPIILENGTAIFDAHDPINIMTFTGEGIYSHNSQDGSQFIANSLYGYTGTNKVGIGQSMYIFNHDRYHTLSVDGDVKPFASSGLLENLFHDTHLTPSKEIISIDQNCDLFISRDFQNEIISSLSNSILELGLTLTPNPTQDIFTLTLDNNDSRSSHISIYNDQGQLMTTQTTDQQQIQFDTSQYPVGVYVVKVQVGDEVVSRKLVVVR